MGSSLGKASKKAEHDVLRNARSVLERRAVTVQNDPGILGMGRKRMVPDSYDENMMNEMSQVLNVTTSYDMNVTYLHSKIFI